MDAIKIFGEVNIKRTIYVVITLRAKSLKTVYP